ncbi:MAG: hypothetical protein K0A89_03345 [ANME-2 cluster archaeon]|nr:hypothetical protein [ANME-2 cluster archaeon]
MYFTISIAAFGVVAFLTLRDIRIFRRTKLESYRRGAMKGMAAMTLALLGVMVVQQNPELGLLLVLIGLFINKKGRREDVFGDAGTAERFFGKTKLTD